MSARRRVLLYAIVGALFGTALDALHVLTGVLSYPNPVLGLQAWWVPLLFAAAGVALGEGHRHIAVPLSRTRPPWASMRATLSGLIMFTGVYASSGFLKDWPYLASGVYLLIFAVALTLSGRNARPSLLIHALGTGLIGPAVEASLSALGLFHYLVADFAGIPVWLFPLYLNAGVASSLVDRWLWASEKPA